MPKNKTIPIAFRVKPEQLSLAITALLKQNPLGDYDKLSKIAKGCFINGLSDLIEKTNTSETSQQAMDVLNQINPKILG